MNETLISTLSTEQLYIVLVFDVAQVFGGPIPDAVEFILTFTSLPRSLVTNLMDAVFFSCDVRVSQRLKNVNT